MKVLVIGGGVGGLAAARALHADGHAVSVFERAGGLRTTGAALTLWSNGTGILADLGVSLDGAGAPVDVLRQCTWDGRHLVDIDVGRAAAVQWWFDVRWSPAGPVPDSPLEALRRRFGHWASPARDVLALAREDDLEFFPHFKHRVPRTWGTGPITLVGDAAHSMPPTRAQGANQALEDAWLLAHELRRGTGALPDVLRGYERTRSRKAGIVARHAGTEDINKYRPWLSRLIPEAFLARYYTYWIKQISDYLPRR
ncbi:FAD-dependent oxidoreductase [Actinomadura sp. 21ATH]|uniref:FAD-dependent oxidoreductase n=1 Tax=Actinomadura sp. 21ATH TaxID=1735444 RepID=UPI0035C2640A